ncbi:RNA polymerase, sigma-24 subunit, ECF subfamily [Catenulispora acidiphila DSM 44928]|uniref:RNA polymerase, sigma-24 subunit, ECF subfamily n=1 Tax=Catenulispora acidiphila (strain DSM 44928 / JCM 14897 / NBRC 102108 / NRRL B-24433 / ID139908) TaxID=479433 RepID=C7QFK4_CATAD|nr:RNA polymerase, sigma-24 subunit, ECF subfamily [Catenulispora acidiphila DSM 44928]
MSDAGQVAELDGARGALVGVRIDGGADFGGDVGDVKEGVGERVGDGADGLEEAVAVFTRVRPRLFGIAYRILSSVTEAEDLVQEVWVRWQTCDRKAVRDPAAFLATTAIRLAINELRSARVRREKYVGPWLPEPVETSADPYLGAERGEALQFAALLLMEKLTPNERAAYVLREAFDYSYPEIADVLGTTGAAVRQSVSRARKHMARERRVSAPAAAQRELLTKFIAAARDGDMAALEQLFAADVASVSDGNGRARVGRRPVVGASRVAKFLKAMSSWFWDGVEVLWVTTNGQTSALLRHDGALWGMITVSVSGEHIDQVLWMFNPEKITARSLPPGLVLDGGFAEVTKASP